jgi:hypothetical protein
MELPRKKSLLSSCCHRKIMEEEFVARFIWAAAPGTELRRKV